MKRSEALMLIADTLSAYIESPSECQEATELVLYMLEEAGMQPPDDVCQIIHEWDPDIFS